MALCHVQGVCWLKFGCISCLLKSVKVVDQISEFPLVWCMELILKALSDNMLVASIQLHYKGSLNRA
jgi:hypothetical protein